MNTPSSGWLVSADREKWVCVRWPVSTALLTWSSEGSGVWLSQVHKPVSGRLWNNGKLCLGGQKALGSSSKDSWGGMETMRLIPRTSSGFLFYSLSPIQLSSLFLLPLPKSQLTHKPSQTQQEGRAHSGRPWPWGSFTQSVQFLGLEVSSNSVPLFILAITGAATHHGRISVPLMSYTHRIPKHLF